MGSSLSFLRTAATQFFPPKSKFSTNQIPDLTGRVAVVTGGSGGIGKEIIRVLLTKNVKVYLAARSREKSEAAIAGLKAQTGKDAIFLELDLGSFASIRAAAKEFLSKEGELHMLFNNAGVMYCPVDQLTAEGYDLQFGTNVVGHFLLTELLMPALLAGKATSPDGHVRVVTLSSFGAYLEPIHWDTFTDGPARRKLSTQSLYHQSKLGNAILAREIAKRYEGVVSVSCNPGAIATDLQRHLHPIVPAISRLLILFPVQYGALSPLWAATMPEALEANGKFLIPWARVGECRREAYDPEIGERLWTWLQAQITDEH